MKRFSRVVAGGAMALASVGLLIPEATAIDLTGTWVGNQTCTIISPTGDKDSSGKIKGLTLKITQDAFDPTLHYMYFVEVNRNYNGVVLDEFKPSGAPVPKAIATFVSCPTATATPGFADLPKGSEMVSANFQFGILDKLAKGTSLVFAEDGSQQSCTWNTFRRVDITDPGIGPCP